MSRIDYSIIGSRFGHLTVLEFSHLDNHRQSHWLCRCDCGNMTIVQRANLTSGGTKTCGCLQHNRMIDNLSGRRFGRLTVVGFDHTDARGNTYWLCECDCGNETIVQRGNLLSGGTLSCGCYSREIFLQRVTTHGGSHTPLYDVWHSMHQRCEDENHKFYQRYGGRGIDVCDEWDDYECFKEWAQNNGYKSGLTLDRECNNLGYCPDNCRWVTQQTQCNNRSSNHYITYNGDTHTIAEWARLLQVNYSTLQGRIKRNDMRDFEEYFKNR